MPTPPSLTRRKAPKRRRPARAASVLVHGAEVRSLLARRDVDPVAVLADILADPDADEQDRRQAAVALLPYSAGRPPRGRQVTREVILEMIEAGRAIARELGDQGRVLETIREALAAEILGTLASHDPDRAAVLGQCVRALEYLESRHKPAIEGTPTVRVLWPFSRHITGDQPAGDNEPAQRP